MSWIKPIIVWNNIEKDHASVYQVEPLPLLPLNDTMLTQVTEVAVAA